MWSVWDQKSEINDFSVENFIARHKHLQNEEIIFIKTMDGEVSQVEGKNTLASVYGIDKTLPNDEFIAEYERILVEPIEAEEVTDES